MKSKLILALAISLGIFISHVIMIAKRIEFDGRWRYLCQMSKN